MIRAALLSAAIALTACGSEPAAGQPLTGDGAAINGAGLASLPCDGSEPLQPAHPAYCERGRVHVRPEASTALIEAAREMARRFPGTVVTFMDGSGADGVVPFEPHLSHGDGRQVDLMLFYTDLDGAALNGRVPGGRLNGYGGYEPPRPGDPQPCRGVDRPNDDRDPPADRAWRLDDARSRAFTEILIADPRVRRILIEPHLERRWGLEDEPKLRFAGCQAARHDDHLHVDFH